jgi:hypothetical protein
LSGSSTNPKFCPNCGTQILHGENFCPSCGSRISIPSTSPSAVPSVPPVQPFTVPLPAKGKPRIKIILLAIVIIAIVLIAVGLTRPFPSSSNPSGSGSGGSGSNGSGNGGTNNARSATFSVYQAPSYTVLIPKGWQAAGGQTSTTYIVPGIYFEAQDSSKIRRIFFAQPDLPQFIDPSSVDSSGTIIGSQCATGNWYFFGTCGGSHGSIVYPYLTATQYVQQILTQPCKYFDSMLCAATSTQHYPTFTLSVDSVTDRPDLLNRQSSWFELTCGPYVNGQSPVTSAASAKLSYTVNGVSYQTGVLVEICHWTLNLPSSGFNSYPSTYKIWTASISGYVAPIADSASVVSTYRTIMPTIVLNFQWAQSVIANSATQETMINNAIQRWQQLDVQMYQITLDTSAAEGWLDALDGVRTGTAGGYSYKIPVGYDYAWVSNSGSSSADVYVSTTNTSPSPGATPITFS